MADTLATSLPLAALDMALQHRRPTEGLVHHSNRGVQYASAAYRERLAEFDFKTLTTTTAHPLVLLQRLPV